MLCQNCNENEANVRYTQIINGVKKQMNLCDKCAKELGIDNISFDMPIDFSNFLADVFEDTENFIPTFKETKDILCDKCKSSYEDFIKNGKFGCDKCYETFEQKIDTLLKNIHGVNKHVGRNGKLLNQKNNKENKNEKQINKLNIKDESEDTKIKQDKIEKLKERLKKEIQEERYEDAAKTRDEIKREENKK